MAHRHILIIWVVSILVFVGVGGRPALANVPVEQFTLARHGVFTELAIHVPGRLLCNHFIEEPKFGKPFRVVLDLCGAIHQLGRKDFENIPPGVISRVRTSQYATTPQNVVRLVLDLTREVSYKVSIDEETIKISLVTPREPDFALWSSIPEKSRPVLTGKPTSVERAEVSATPEVTDLVPQTGVEESAIATEAEKHKPQAAERVEPVLADVVPVAPVAAQVSAPKKRQTPERAYAPYEEVSHIKEALSVKPAEQIRSPIPTVESQKTVSTQPTEEKVTQEVSPEESKEQFIPAASHHDFRTEAKREEPVRAVKEKDKTSDAEKEAAELVFVQTTEQLDESLKPEVQQKPVRRPIVQYDSPAGPEWTEKPAVALVESDADLAPTVPESQPAVVTTQPAEPVVIADSALVVTQEDFEKITPTAAAKKEEKLPLLARLKQKFFGSADEEQVMPDAGTDSAALARIRTLAKISKVTVPQDEGDAEQAIPPTPRRIDHAELESKIAGVIQSAMEPGSAHAASEAEIGLARTTEKPAGKGAPVSVEPSRKKVEYDRAGRRDPFDALIEGQRSGLWTTALPRVESLRLVGILEDYDGTIALFEDMEGYGYILQEGDPVKNGYVKLVGEDRVLFQVDDYGWVHTIVLELRKDAPILNYDYAKESEDD